MSMVQATDLVHEYIRRDEEGNVESINTALNKLNINVEKGEFVAILGHNGSGKSTFAKHINVLLKGSEGTLYVNGYDAADKKNIWNIRQSAGIVMQNPDNQIIGTVVEEDVAFGPENIGIPTDEIIRRVEKSLDKVGMLEHRYESPNKLSGGQKQKVAIAGILALKPKCIVLDEPTAMLDPRGRKDVIETVTWLNKEEGITVILVTHNMDEVVAADRVIIMDKGAVVKEGTPREVFEDIDGLTKLKLDVPQVTKIGDNLRKSGIPISKVILTVDELVEEIATIANVISK
ncbi:MAG: energy-coupling factor transporter ATPase [Lachnospiraceae bacterium]|nr:energy-coupling factor transporter ATPase [Lachnospiraceae bacterium]